VSGADVKFAWPFSAQAVMMPLFAMADPWLLALLVAAAIALARFRTPRVWATGMSILLCAVLAKDVLYRVARRMQAPMLRPDSSVRAEARWGSWARWLIFQADALAAEAVEVDVARGSVRRVAHEARHLEDPLAIRSMQLDTVRNFLGSHAQTFARIGPGGASVLWSDLRYCHLDGAGPADGRAPSCAVWFGGEFDSNGRPRALVGRIGPILQRRIIPDADAHTAAGDPQAGPLERKREPRS
jgi:hypothetical protein